MITKHPRNLFTRVPVPIIPWFCNHWTLCLKLNISQVRASAPTMVPIAHHNYSGASPVQPNRRRTDVCALRNTIAICQIACRECQDVFNSLRDLHRHTIGIHDHYRYTRCNAKFTQRSKRLRHSLKQEGCKPLPHCRLCYVLIQKVHLAKAFMFCRDAHKVRSLVARSGVRGERLA